MFYTAYISGMQKSHVVGFNATSAPVIKNNTKDIITLNLPHGEGSVDFAAMVKICLGISLFFTYPMMMFPVTHLLDKTFGFTAVPYKGNIMRLLLVCVTGLVVSAVPNFAILMGLIGATCCTLLAFILPAAFHMCIFKQRLTKKQWYFDAMLIFLGVTGSIIGVWDAFNRIHEHDPSVRVDEFSHHGNHSNSTSAYIAVKPIDNLSNLTGAVHIAIKGTESNLKIPLPSAGSDIDNNANVISVSSLNDTTHVENSEMATQNVAGNISIASKSHVLIAGSPTVFASTAANGESSINSSTYMSSFSAISENNKSGLAIQQTYVKAGETQNGSIADVKETSVSNIEPSSSSQKYVNNTT
ncbi:hypothetical protein SK128_002407 [Halocaridina rubra]|uniref:Amino acid transporter transmembrane domain-containing protein n=1 Tax=Halocaridina rubra TaxID=373956 RepID=A0AAN8X9D2_HALRR